MPEPEYTPGPWNLLYEPPKWIGMYHEFRISVEEGRDIIANVFGSLTNARLIVAAPDLLEALEAIVADGDNSLEIIKVASWKRAIAAIAKAKGGS